jgi:hypothetical protein
LPYSASRTAASSGSGVSARNATVDGGQFRPQAEINGQPGAVDQKVEAHIAQRRTDTISSPCISTDVQGSRRDK